MEARKIALMVMTDGRGDCLQKTLMSFEEKVRWHIAVRLMIDDSADPQYAKLLDDRYAPDFKIIHHAARRGFAGAIQSGWSEIPPDCDYIVHLEDDFTFNEPIILEDMVTVLEAHPYIAQMCLRRQPWGSEPKEGGFIAMWPNAYLDKEWNGHNWLEHNLFFSSNPSLYPARIIKSGWPDAPNSEGKFGPKLWAAGMCAAFWGKREDPPKVHHIGNERVGNGY